ncbi:MAG TPA: NTP transferase domain-containing protein [Terriglobales bacterium]
MSLAPGKAAVSAIVLAAGMSRRMGTPKQLLRVGDRTLLELTLENVRKSTVGEIILVLGFAAAEIQEKVSTQGLKVVLNSTYQEGMAGSVGAGIAAVDPVSEAALIVLADQPSVRPATLDRLINHHRKLRRQIVIPSYKGFRGNPVLLDRSVFLEVMAITGDVGCRAIFAGHTESIHKLEVDDVGILLDVDTTSDLAAIGAEHAGERATPGVSDLEIRGGVDPQVSAARQPDLAVVGRDALAVALIRLAKLLHYTTTIVDPVLGLRDLPEVDRVLHRLDFSLLPQNRDRYIIVASRGQFDEDAVEQALKSSAPYVGLVAGKKRAQEVTTSLQRKAISAEQIGRLKTSAGLALGAESPEEIALSIMAEIVAVRRGAAK